MVNGGPGADLRGFAAATGPGGRVIGVDSDAAALTEAQSEIRAGEPIELVHGDIHGLDLPDAVADRTHRAGAARRRPDLGSVRRPDCPHVRPVR
ncbi:methyltransferase domain-containing protein [Nocardia sp. AB354]|uniref:methyltransferase domain-containing protein n=1 Tax=Nocardia sp. AB354 TaxID=3413283 RepID=UPI003C165D01